MRRFLPIRVLSLVALFLQACLIPAEASPTITPHWGACPYGSDPLNIGPGDPRADTITVTATGLTGTIRGFFITVRISTGDRGGVPDAWRFDEAGCEAGHLFVNSPAAIEPCPQLLGNHPGVFQAVDYLALPSGPSIAGFERLFFVAGFDPFVCDPAKTYTLASFRFDRPNVYTGGQASTVGCGCFERPLCIELYAPTYLDSDGRELPFNILRSGLGWNDPGNELSCGSQPCDLSPEPCYFEGDTLCVGGPTPAVKQSWGSLKASYR